MVLRAMQDIYHRVCPRIVVTKNIRGLRCRLNINDHLQWLVLPEQQSVESETFGWVDRSWGTVWDVGANFGFYSLVAARRGNRTVAFDVSPSAIDLLKQSCRLNDLVVQCVPRAITVTPCTYMVPKTSSCKNSVRVAEGPFTSLPYLKAAEEIGIPNFIKMDIEGGEKEFLESNDFRQWVREHGITLCVEVHNGYRVAEGHFSSMRVITIDGSHQVITPAV